MVSSTRTTSPVPITRLSPSLAVIFTTRVEIDDVLAAGRRVPVGVVLGLGLAKDDAGGRQAFGQFAAAPFFDPLHFDVAEMGLAAGIGIEIVYAHAHPSSDKFSIDRLNGGVTICA